MRITSAEFLTSAVSPAQYPADGGPEVAFVGRSNVGKSSLINTLLNRRGLAKTSATPGKTRTINFFRVNGTLGFVDLPGYGFAQVSRTERAVWGPMVEQFFRTRQRLQGVVQLIDIRHDPTAEDHRTRAWLLQWQRPLLVVATKVDKIGRPQRPKHLKAIAAGLSLEAEAPLLVFSAQTGEGRERVWEWIRQVTGV
ncbi:MAG TPA: ribosome biogenesis GTP-binding protein YihA/YsxC [Candidatus Tectomicrobia bacterium]|nr:ribosome biogenesis GTP-binding protein YihA/YsxC [Candidatus Tectomicrobia bacterium]